MNDDAQLIRAALDRRFARLDVPECPPAAWQMTAPPTAANAQRSGLRRRFAYAAAALVAVAIGGLTAQAAPVINKTLATFMFVSSKPLQRIIHKADQLTIAQAQRSIPFTIVELAGLPAGTQFLYAHTINDRVALNYQAHLGGKYYRIAITESNHASGPPVAHFTSQFRGRIFKRVTLPLRRWKHGELTMEMLDPGFPAGLADRIVRANTQ